ncbi:ubiquitin-conjugating enzyme [Cryptosporidium ubiquitum]|uniref:Ubiquitin-conjugating enzyme n=1 Tax=Cryptosporidium ubiquitum TaxID=857276 RepID=A0A1J4MDV3_9CRYT|nr:ubiquitin-conjugating enzyme [Cryptosporidium ubiquitum]OII72408.1 ubiquitin-conjugating enzyme [Cryptosporidium ubiquitum]
MNLALWNPTTLEVENSRLTYFPIRSDQLLKKNRPNGNNDDKLVRQIILDYKCLIDYSCLLEFSPDGLYVVPEYENIYTWQGGIFVRSGLYARSFYRFQIELALEGEYTSDGSGLKTHKVEFLNPPAHPLVNNSNGLLYIPDEWQSKIQNNILALLFFIKNIFYLPELLSYKLENEEVGNFEMSESVRNDSKKAVYKIQRNVKDSIEKSCRLYNSKFSPFKLNFHFDSEHKEDKEEEKQEFHYNVDDNLSTEIVEYIKECVNNSSNIVEQKELLSEWILNIVDKHQSKQK